MICLVVHHGALHVCDPQVAHQRKSYRDFVEFPCCVNRVAFPSIRAIR